MDGETKMFSNFVLLIFALTFFRIITHFRNLFISLAIRKDSTVSLSVREKIVEKRLPAAFRKALINIISWIPHHTEILEIVVEIFYYCPVFSWLYIVLQRQFIYSRYLLHHHVKPSAIMNRKYHHSEICVTNSTTSWKFWLPDSLILCFLIF